MNQGRLSTSIGTLTVTCGKQNPTGFPHSTLYLLNGDATQGKINRLLPEEGVVLPARNKSLVDSDFHLTIFHFNDLHGHLVRFSPAGEDAVISRMAWKIREKRISIQNDEHQAVLTLSAGDDCIGSIFDELLGSSPSDFQVHASYALYSAMGVDAACLGNHDFDLGSDLLTRSIAADAHFPILASNLSGCTDLMNLCSSAAILLVKGIRIGLLGLITPAELKIIDPDCRVANPIEAVKNILPAIQPWCDAIIILSHLGLSLTNSTVPMAVAGDVELAQSLPFGSVQLIIGGHSHHELNAQGLSPKNIINGIPIVQTGSLGRFLGQVDLHINQRSSAVTNVRLLPTSNFPVDENFESEYVQPILKRARSLFSRSLGIVENNYELGTEYVRSSYAAGELALANFITDAMVKRLCLTNQAVDLAMIDSSSLRQGLTPGAEITLGEWFNVMPFADTIRIYKLTGSQLFDLLQDNARRMDRPNEPHTERGFLQFSQQLRYVIVLGKNRASTHAIDILVNGTPLKDQMGVEFTIAGTSFLREYASSWEIIDEQRSTCDLMDLNRITAVDTDIFLRREITAYIQENGGVTRESGALKDGRLKVMDQLVEDTDQISIKEFVENVSNADHAMAGAVIAVSGAQAVALGLACAKITKSRLRMDLPELESSLEKLILIRDQLLDLSKKDAQAIKIFVALREAGQELRGKDELCELPYQVSSLCIQAGMLMQDFRQKIDERVRDDLEMSINLLAGTARSALLLLDSNLRIWQDGELLQKYEPLFTQLSLSIKQLQPLDRIRKKL